MAKLLVGESILNCKLLLHADKSNLKHSTYDLTIGRIFPVGESSKRHDTQLEGGLYFLEPRQSVLVISREEFQLPPTITGLATLRTTLTKNGLLALNVGIIDPFFNGPISTTLINFSDQKIPIKVGMPFFRVLFFEHDNTQAYHQKNESKRRCDYEEELIIAAHRDFPKSFLNIPDFNNAFYAETARNLLKGLTVKYWYAMVPFYIFLISLLGYIFSNTGYLNYLENGFRWLKGVVPFF